MRPNHPKTALVFVGLVDVAALALLVVQWPQFAHFTLEQWISTVVFAICMAGARMMAVMGAGSIGIGYGWFMAVEFAIIAALPVPLACLAQLPGLPVEALHRVSRRLPEPWLSPRYNAAASILCAFTAGHFLRWMAAAAGGLNLWKTVVLLPAAVVFMAVQYVLIQTLVSLDKRVPWHKTGVVHVDSVIGDVMMTLVGALIGRLYDLDRSTILLTLVPLALLQGTLQSIQIAKLAHIDPKTNLYNYRYLDVELNEEVRRATQSGRPLSLIFGDMDYLRDINNTYGHLAGDRALKAVARVFKLHARPGDVAARFGGEEFVLLLPGLEKEQALGIAEQIRQETASQILETDDGGVFTATISLGLASFPTDATTVQGLIKAADEAVYAAKHGGRNRVCVCQRTGVVV
jgi:diguanylate cyclase (GGDEF)-like protein